MVVVVVVAVVVVLVIVEVLNNVQHEAFQAKTEAQKLETRDLSEALEV